MYSLKIFAGVCSKDSYLSGRRECSFGKPCHLPCIILFLFSISFSAAAQQETNYAVHANIIYHFTKYIDWPSYTKSGDFIIGIAGESPMYDELKKSTVNKMAGNQRIVIKQLSSADEMASCHILFISEEESGNLKKIIAKTAGLPVLLVSESEGQAKKGSCINFSIVSDHLKLEINRSSIEQRGLSIASELIKLGKVVK